MILRASNGMIHGIYNDVIRRLPLVVITVSRASHVVPQVVGGDILWFSDMELSNGPVFGPFETREAALKTEVNWLEYNLRGNKSE